MEKEPKDQLPIPFSLIRIIEPIDLSHFYSYPSIGSLPLDRTGANKEPLYGYQKAREQKIMTMHIRGITSRENRSTLFKRSFLIGFLSLWAILSGNAQYELNEAGSFVYLEGTSSLHDWTAEAGKMNGTIDGVIEDQRVKRIDEARIAIPVTAMKSGKEKMDENMYEALKAEKHPRITFQLKDHKIHNGNITVQGGLTIAGVTNPVEANVSQKGKNGHVKIAGEMTLKMSDFNVKPPEFLWGAFKTEDKVKVRFYFMFEAEKKTETQADQ